MTGHDNQCEVIWDGRDHGLDPDYPCMCAARAKSMARYLQDRVDAGPPCEMCGRYGCDPKHHAPIVAS